MSSKLLSNVGEALYGPRWQTELSRRISVSDRTVRRWASGADDVPSGVYYELLGALTERAVELDDVIAEVSAMLKLPAGGEQARSIPVPQIEMRPRRDKESGK
ncbi:hypothetical protein [Bradyrhizobium prioriisuperbiae]|uniref:hypothetical protein n=1 Tax=Bradyrhizobium prioriisuperbiae TaxID=2854389 RepID=UPI0028E9020C|nr:hypothetical protein [Bradyrhizobium prioritasuperba]